MVILCKQAKNAIAHFVSFSYAWFPFDRPDRGPDRPNRFKRGRSDRDDHMETEMTRTIGTITIAWIASSSIRTISTIVNNRKRLNGNHSCMTGTIEAIQMYSKLHQLFQDSFLFLHCVPKHAFQNGGNKHERVERKLLHQCMIR